MDLECGCIGQGCALDGMHRTRGVPSKAYIDLSRPTVCLARFVKTRRVVGTACIDLEYACIDQCCARHGLHRLRVFPAWLV